MATPRLIPKKIVLPFGYVIPVVQLPHKEFHKAVHTEFGSWDPNCEAFMHQTDGGTCKIILDKGLTLVERRRALVHELQHCMVEYNEYVQALPDRP